MGDVEVLSGNVKLAMSHVVPDLVQKAFWVRIRSHPGRRFAGEALYLRRGPCAGHRDGYGARRGHEPGFQFVHRNLHHGARTSRRYWHKVHGPDEPFRYVSDAPFEHDVAKRVPSVDKAKQVLGFEATTTLEEMLDEVIPWVRNALKEGII